MKHKLKLRRTNSY